MSCYEFLGLTLTALYDVLTLGILATAVYATAIVPRQANLALFFRWWPKDTEEPSWRRQTVDFVIENRGPELRNIVLSSRPDDLGWGNMGPESKAKPRPTSSYFLAPIPYLAQGERYAFLWCDMEANVDIVRKPFEIVAEYDNPALPFPRRQRKVVRVDFSGFQTQIWGLNEKFDVHNVAQELVRIRKRLGEP